jgi:hypothetical protein
MIPLELLHKDFQILAVQKGIFYALTYLNEEHVLSVSAAPSTIPSFEPIMINAENSKRLIKLFRTQKGFFIRDMDSASFVATHGTTETSVPYETLSQHMEDTFQRCKTSARYARTHGKPLQKSNVDALKRAVIFCNKKSHAELTQNVFITATKKIIATTGIHLVNLELPNINPIQDALDDELSMFDGVLGIKPSVVRALTPNSKISYTKTLPACERTLVIYKANQFFIYTPQQVVSLPNVEQMVDKALSSIKQNTRTCPIILSSSMATFLESLPNHDQGFTYTIEGSTLTLSNMESSKKFKLPRDMEPVSFKASIRSVLLALKHFQKFQNAQVFIGNDTPRGVSFNHGNDFYLLALMRS